MSQPVVTLWSDLACPWAHLAVWRLHEARKHLHLEGRVVFDHRAFPLEVFNGRPTPKAVLDAEIPVVGALDPDAGWQMWQGDDADYPVTTLPALEAVQAAKRQGTPASEQLDRALRVAFFGQSCCISMRAVILEVAEACPDVDAGVLEQALDEGSARSALMEQQREAEAVGVKGSPFVCLPDGTSVHNPGVTMHWHGEHGEGFPVVDDDDPSIYGELLRSAVG